MLAEPIDTCPVCGGHAERKISGGTGLIFKGSGFYITDYARKSGGEATSSTPNAKPTPSKDKPAPKAASTPSGESKE